MGTGRFLSRLPAKVRDRLLPLGQELVLEQGAYLIRRGDPGGDVFLVTEGTLEVVDDRHRPEVILDTVGEGDILGDMAFLEQTPRSAHVRAASQVVCSKLQREHLLELFDRDGTVGTAFYRALCERMADRHRELTTAAVVGGIGRTGTLSNLLMPWVEQQCSELTLGVRSAFTAWQTVLRGSILADVEGHDDRDFPGEVREFVEASSAFLSRFPAPAQMREAGRVIASDLHSWLARSDVGRCALERKRGAAGIARLRASMLARIPRGADAFGGELDRVLRELPTVVAIRQGRDATRQAAQHLLLDRTSARVALFGTNPGSWVDDWRGGAELSCVAWGGGDANRRQERHELVTEAVDLLQLARSPRAVRVRPFDLVVIDGLADHLTTRVLRDVLRFCRAILVPGGGVAVSVLPPTPDEPFFVGILDYPTVRRTHTELASAVQEAGLHPSESASPMCVVGVAPTSP